MFRACDMSAARRPFRGVTRRRRRGAHEDTTELTPRVLTAVEGDDEGVIDDADGSAGFVGIGAVSTSTWRNPSERGRPRRWSFRAVPPRRFRSSALRASGAARLATDRSGHLARRSSAGCRQGGGADHRVRGRKLSTVRRHSHCRAVVIGAGGEHPGVEGDAGARPVARREGRDRTGVDRCRQVTYGPA